MSVLRDRIVDDYLHRATLRREAMNRFYEKSSWVDVVRDGRMVVDMVMLAAMHHSGLAVPGRYVAADRLPSENMTNVRGIERLLEKERQLLVAGQVVPSDYYSRQDADSAIEMADNMFKLFVPHLRPQMAEQLAVIPKTAPARRVAV